MCPRQWDTYSTAWAGLLGEEILASLVLVPELVPEVVLVPELVPELVLVLVPELVLELHSHR